MRERENRTDHEDYAGILRRLEVSPKLDRENLSSVLEGLEPGDFDYSKLELSEQEKLRIKMAVDVLLSEDTMRFVDEGYLTFAMIRPRADISEIEGKTDNEAAQFILDTITEESGDKLQPVFVASLVLDEATVEKFYNGEPRANQERVPPVLEKGKFANRWEEFVDLMTSGPSTIIIFYSPDQLAVDRWRKTLGRDWRVKQNLPETIRYRFGKNNHNNIGHGSDAAYAAIREIKIIAEHLRKIAN